MPDGCDTHAESVSVVLEEDVVDAPVLGEELLDVSLADVVGQVTHEYAGGVAGGHRSGRGTRGTRTTGGSSTRRRSWTR